MRRIRVSLEDDGDTEMVGAGTSLTSLPQPPTEVIAVECLPGLLLSEAPAPPPYDAVNMALVTLIGDQPIEAFRDMLQRAHERCLCVPEVQDDTCFVPGHPIYAQTKAAIGVDSQGHPALGQSAGSAALRPGRGQRDA